MHELSIATGIIDVASSALGDAGEERPVEIVRVRVGDLAGVVVEALEFAWTVAIEGTRCQNAALEIERVPGKVRCAACDRETVLGTPPKFACAACGVAIADITAGQELDLVSLELADPPTTDTNTTDQEPVHASANP